MDKSSGIRRPFINRGGQPHQKRLTSLQKYHSHRLIQPLYVSAYWADFGIVACGTSLPGSCPFNDMRLRYRSKPSWNWQLSVSSARSILLHGAFLHISNNGKMALLFRSQFRGRYTVSTWLKMLTRAATARDELPAAAHLFATRRLENSAQSFYISACEDDLGHHGDSERDGPVTYRRINCARYKTVFVTRSVLK